MIRGLEIEKDIWFVRGFFLIHKDNSKIKPTKRVKFVCFVATNEPFDWTNVCSAIEKTPHWTSCNGLHKENIAKVVIDRLPKLIDQQIIRPSRLIIVA